MLFSLGRAQKSLRAFRIKKTWWTKPRAVTSLTIGALVAVVGVGSILAPNAHAYTADDFVIVVKTDNPGSSNATSFTLPAYRPSTPFNVDCTADGVVDFVSDGILPVTCTYGSPGTYTIAITGLRKVSWDNSGDYQKLLEVKQWGTTAWDSMAEAFILCSNLHVTATDVPNLTNVTDMSSMFNGASSMNENINHWNVSHVINMSNVFSGATAFNQPLSNWNTSAVTNMNGMFAYATAFNQPLSNWNTSAVTNMSNMFTNTAAFNQSLTGWDTSAVTDMNRMFSFASGFNQAVNALDTSAVRDMTMMFYNATQFNQPVGSWNTGAVTSMNYMFEGAIAFNQPVGSWNTGAVTSMAGMFSGAVAFNQPVGAWDMKSVTNAGFMFTNTKLSTYNYDLTLKGWRAQTLKSNVQFRGGNSTFCLAQVERNAIIANFAWNIVDAGMDCADYQPTAMNFSGTTAIDENVGVSLPLGTLTPTDTAPNTLDTYTYSATCAVRGAQDSYFSLAGNQLSLAIAPDYETTPTLSTCVRVTNAANQTLDRTYSFTVNNLNTVTYSGNGSTGGSAPAAAEIYRVGDIVTVAGNSGGLSLPGLTFNNWNTAADGSGAAYAPGQALTIGGDTALYAQWVDITPPASPSDAPLLLASSDTGTSNIDGITSQKMPTFAVACTETGSSVTLYANATEVATAACLDSGPLDLEIPAALSDGTYAVTFRETDSKDNMSAMSPAFNLVVDTASPTGTLSSATVNSTSPELIGTVSDPQGQIVVTIANKPYAAFNNSDGTWKLPAGAMEPKLAEGDHGATITLTDLAGNTTTLPSQTITVVIPTSTLDLSTLPAASNAATENSIKNTTITTKSDTCYTLDAPSIATLGTVGVSAPTSGINLLGGVAFNVTCTTTGGSSDVELALGTHYTDVSKLRAYKTSGTALTDITSQVTFTNKLVGGVNKTVISYSLVDGGAFDEDGATNSTIVDPIYIGEVAGAGLTTPTATGGSLASTGFNVYLFTALAGTLLVGAVVLWRKVAQPSRRVSLR